MQRFMDLNEMATRTFVRSLLPCVASAVSLALLAACSSLSLSPVDSLVQRLADRGPVPVTKDNPFLAGNLFLDRERERSPELKGFLERRGTPAALEISESFFAPLQVQLYYPAEKEQYTLEPLDSTWAIRGPARLDQEAATALSKLSLSEDASSKKSPTERPRLAPTPLGRSQKIKDEPATGLGFKSPAIESTAAAPAPRFADAASEERAELESLVRSLGKQEAEISPKGDLVHYVTFPGETLPLIARWYTFDRSNGSRLARMNQLANPDHLAIGDVIVIPSYLLKNRYRLTEEALTRLNSSRPSASATDSAR